MSRAWVALEPKTELRILNHLKVSPKADLSKKDSAIPRSYLSGGLGIVKDAIAFSYSDMATICIKLYHDRLEM
jgi:hypothetical protein